MQEPTNELVKTDANRYRCRIFIIIWYGLHERIGSNQEKEKSRWTIDHEKQKNNERSYKELQSKYKEDIDRKQNRPRSSGLTVLSDQFMLLHIFSLVATANFFIGLVG